MRKYNSKSYLIATVFTLALSGVYSVPAWPLFIKWFVPFPKLEQSVIYEGALEFQGGSHSSKFGEATPNYFIVTKHDRQQIFWGFPGSEEDRFLGKDIFRNIQAKVWFHPIFGIIQEEFIITPSLAERIPSLRGRSTFGNKYSDGAYDVFMNHFNYSKYKWAAFPSLVGLLLSTYFFIRHRKQEL